MSTFAKVFHASALILSTTGTFRDLCASKFDENIINGACRRTHGIGTGYAPEATKPRAVSLIKIHVRKRDLFQLKMFLDVYFRPIQKRMAANMIALGKDGFPLIP